MSISGRKVRTAIRSSWGTALVFVMLGVIPLGVLAALVENRATDAVRTEARNSLSGTTSLTALFLEEQLRGIEKVMGSYARRNSVQQALEGPRGIDARALTRQMNELRGARSDVLNVAGIADTAGTMLAGTVMPPPGTDFSQRDWHRSVLRTGRAYVSEAIAGRSPGSPLAIAVATPVRDGDQRIVAIIVVGYTLDNLQEFVENFADDRGVDVTVTDQRGVVIARPGSPPTSLDSRLDDPRVRSALAGRSGVTDGDRNPAGEPVLSAHVPVPGLGWTVVAERPRELAYAEIDRLQTKVVLITVPLALLLALGGGLLARALRSRDRARERAERLASINNAVLEASREGLTLVDPTGRRLLRNATMQDIGAALGAEPDADIYSEIARLAPGMADPDAFAASGTALASAPDLELADEFTLAPSGRSFSRYSRSIRNDAGVLLGRLFVIRETTVERKAEAEARQAKDEAEHANAAKTEFLSRMSHELRTPLHAILGFGELLEREEHDPGKREKLAQMTSGGRHLLGLINEVLDLARIERGELSLSIEPVHLDEVIGETLALTGPLAAARSVRVRSPGDADLDVHVLADRQRLKQILLNLLSNAVKYNHEGGEVSIACTRPDAATLRVEVTDTGPGIAPDMLPRVFGEFERLDAEATGVEGTGLGLTISRRLVEAMGGEIGVDSKVGEGARFWFELPVTAPPQARPAQPKGDEQVHPVRARGPARSVLVVEDNPSNIKLVETILADRPAVTLLVATEGGRALELALERQPALVLLDLNLPDMSGREVLQRLRGDDRTSEIPVVIVSADATPGEIERLLAAGADGYLTKPFDIDAFLAIIDGSTTASPTVRKRNGNGVLDRAAIQALHGLASSPNVGPSAMHDLIRAFFVDAATRLDLLKTAIRDEDMAAVTSEAHAMRGGSSGLGAVEVSAICRRLEVAAERGELLAAQTAVLDLDDALRSAHAALAREFGFEQDGDSAEST